MTKRSIFLPCLALLALCQCAFGQQVLQISNYSSSWLGNTFGGAGDISGNNSYQCTNNVQMGFDAICAAPNGAVYTSLSWDESHKGMGIYKSGTDLGQFNTAGPGGQPLYDQWCFPDADGGAIAVSGSWVFVTVSRNDDQRHQGQGWLRRYSVSTLSPNPASTQGNLTDIQVTGSTAAVAGLAVSGTQVFASDSVNNRIMVYDANLWTYARQFTVPDPGRSTVDNSGNLWIISGASPVVLHYSPAGARLSGTITFASGVQPEDIAFLSGSNVLMVADSGTAQNIKFYSTSPTGAPTTIVGAFGIQGGIYSGTDGQQLPLKFFSPSSVSSDGSGNIYIGMQDKDLGHSLGGSLASYAVSTGSLNWELDNLTYVDCADVDPQSETNVYTKDKHFTMNYGNSPGKEWSYTAHTVDPVKYPQDLRITATNGAEDSYACLLGTRRIGGQLIMYLTDMYSRYVAIYRFNTSGTSDIAIPCGMIGKYTLSGTWNGPTEQYWPPTAPQTGEWIWRDGTGGTLDGQFQAGEFTSYNGTNSVPNSWGWDVDSAGDITLAGTNCIRMYKCGGLDGNGCPTYSYATSGTPSMIVTNMPAPFTSMYRAEYEPTNDSMYVLGYTAAFPNSYETGTNAQGQPVYGPLWGKGAGRVLVKYTNWSTTPTEAFEIDNLLYEPSDLYQKDCNISAFTHRGNYLFVQYGGMVSNTPNTQQTQVYSAATGALIGCLLPTGTVASGTAASLGSAQIDEGFGVRAYERTNGEYLAFVEDDWFGKVLMYRWTPGTGQTVMAIDCGSTTGTGAFVADTDYSGSTSTQSTSTGIDTTGVNNPAPKAVYQTNRYANPSNSMTYTLGGLIPGAEYTARLHFSEDFFTSAGSREFNVSINNTQVLKNFDIFAAAGAAYKANIQEFLSTTDTNGVLTIAFTDGAKNNPQCNGIEICGPAQLSVICGSTSAYPFISGTNSYVSISGSTLTSAIGLGTPISTGSVTNPAPEEVYHTSYYCGASGSGSNFTYTLGGYTPNASYTVRLHFAENHWTGPGERVFNAYINGTQVLQNFDVFADAGGEYIADITEFDNVPANASGQFVIEFANGSADRAMCSGIEILMPQ